jgi:hypothetical protein
MCMFNWSVLMTPGKETLDSFSILSSNVFQHESNHAQQAGASRVCAQSTKRYAMLLVQGVLDPYPIFHFDVDPDTSSRVANPDPYVFGPIGSGSRALYHQAKIVRKTLVPTVL